MARAEPIKVKMSRTVNRIFRDSLSLKTDRSCDNVLFTASGGVPLSHQEHPSAVDCLQPVSHFYANRFGKWVARDRYQAVPKPDGCDRVKRGKQCEDDKVLG
jgi:hypothetical protein